MTTVIMIRRSRRTLRCRTRDGRGRSTVMAGRSLCRPRADALAVDEVERLGGGAARLLEALFPLPDGGLADAEEGGEHGLAAARRRPDALHLLRREGPLRREAQAVEFPHGHVGRAALVVKPFGGRADVLKNPALSGRRCWYSMVSAVPL